MATTRWDNLKHKASPEQRAKIREEVRAEILEDNLRGIRELAGKTQQEVAVVLHVKQGKVSDVERRDDHLVSTLRNYVEALGGELEVVATIGDKRIRLRGV